MKEITEKMVDEFHQAKPFKHLIIDDFISPKIFKNIVLYWPKPKEWMDHIHNDTKKEVLKRQYRLEISRSWDDPIKTFLWQINNDFHPQVQKLFNYPIYNDVDLTGAGLHQHQAGGFLNFHIDFNKIEKYDAVYQRCLNTIFYVHPEWKPEWGGHTNLGADELLKDVEPVPNRILIFEATEESYHGCRLVTCPIKKQRRTIATYFYKEAEAGISQHSTRYKK